MPEEIRKRGTFSEKLFHRLLAVYPREHRAEYGAAMTQLFRDQHRDAAAAAGGWGVLKLWLHVLPDVLRTSVLEHFAQLKRRKFMLSLLRPRLAPVLAFISVCLLTLCTSTLLTFLLPESFRSVARVVAHRPNGDSGYDPNFLQTECAMIQSQAVLEPAIDKLQLNVVWGKKYASGTPLKTAESLSLFRNSLELRPVLNTELIEIRAYSEQPEEAARIANAVAESYRDYRRSQQPKIDPSIESYPSTLIVDRAEPGLRPVRPNKPLNLFVGTIAGIILGLLAGAGTAGINLLSGRNSKSKPTIAPAM